MINMINNLANKIDFLSPPITLFHLEKRTHTSNVGGFLIVIMVSACTLYISFLLYDLINHKKITSIFHKRFEYEAGYYSFNSSSIFHFIQIFSPENGGYFDKYESKYIRAYTTYVHSNFSYGNLDLYDHWVFDTCRKDIDDKDLEPHLFENVENFTNGVCIRYYYNSTERKYYSLEDGGFSWPHLEHGIAQRNNIYLTTIVQKCSNDSIINKIFGQCPTQKEIDDYINKYFGIYLYFTDTQVDPNNYVKPVQKYLQVISTGIGTPQTFVESYIHFSPLKVITKIGSLIGRKYDINSFYFDFNRKGSANNNEKYFTITKYYHLMQNNVQIYERKYNNIFDIFSEIGGVIQFIFYLFYWINYAYNKYIIALNTNSLFFSIRDNQSLNKENYSNNNNNILNQNNINLKSVKSIRSSRLNRFDIFSKDDNNKKGKRSLDSGNVKNQIKIIINQNNGNINTDLPKRITAKRSKTKLSINQNSSNLFLKESNNTIIKNKLKKENNFFTDIYRNIEINNGHNHKNIYKNDYRNIFLLPKGSIIKAENKKSPIEIQNNQLKDMKYFSFFDYVKSILFKNNSKNNHNFIRIFRKQLLSEEHLLKCNIKMIFLEKKCSFEGNENTNFLECFNEL